MRKVKEIDINKIIELYDKFGSMNRTALSLDISPPTLKKILIKNNIEIKKPKSTKWEYNLHSL